MGEQRGDAMAGAVFSACLTWRYLLWRSWADMVTPLRTAMWIMLNPSTADDARLDPTCTRVREFTRAWGYSRFIVGNLFALRSTDPDALYAHHDPVGPENDRYLIATAREANLVVCGWGNHAALEQRGRAVAAALLDAGVRLHLLRLNGSGHPAHPLYLPGSLRPTPWPAPFAPLPAASGGPREG